MTAFVPLISARAGTQRVLRAVYPLIGEGAPVTEIHVAMEGEWEGHPAGPFELNEQVFARIVENFERNPNPVPLDYEHSTVSAFEAPAAGWVQKLEVRRGDDGLAHLYATVELTDKAAEYIRTGAYRFSSGVFDFDAIDPRTGEDIGAEMSSLALTNVPFIQGQRPISLSRRPARSAARTTERIASMKVSKESLMAALEQLEGDELGMEQLKAAAQFAAAQDGEMEPSADEEPTEAGDGMPYADKPGDDGEEAEMASEAESPVEAADEPGDDEVEASAPVAAEDDDDMAEDQAMAALAPLLEETGMDMAQLAAAMMENREAVAEALKGSAGAPMSESEAVTSLTRKQRETELALKAKEHALSVLQRDLDEARQHAEELAAFKAEAEKADARRWACSLRDAGKITDADVDEWAELRRESPDRAERLCKGLTQVVPLGRHATGTTPPTRQTDADAVAIPEDEGWVKAVRAELSRQGVPRDVQDRSLRKQIVAARKRSERRDKAKDESDRASA